MMRILIAMLFCGAAAAAQGPRILIVTDMEGLEGVNDAEEQILPGQRRYEETRRILIGDVNAAIEGASQGGASEIVVWDGHDGSRSLSVEDIASPGKLLQGRPTPANYYMSERAYDGIIFIGQHPMAGTKNGVLAHSQSFNVRQISINGKPVGELGQVAAIGGYFGIPVIMLTGDEMACAEMLALQPKAFTVPLKRQAGKLSTLSISHAEAVSRTREAARKAVQSVKDFQPWKIEGPVELKFEFHPQPPQQPEARTVIYKGRTVLEAFEAWLGK
jgi:D-amino peptidase